MKRAIVIEKIWKVLMYASIALVLFFVVSVIWSVFKRGLPVLSWEMVSSLPGGGFYIGKEGGFLNAIVGSICIVCGATVLGLLVSIPVVFYLNVYLKPHSKFGAVARLAYDVLFGIPSIVYGAFGFTIMIFFGLRTSLLGGIIQPNEVVVLVCPVDSEAPEGRLILPQVMAIRDVLDNECICVVLKETHLQQYLDTMPKPALIVTDSQVFGFVSKIVPADIPLTSFSIVMARLRGDFDNYVKGTPHLSQLKDGDTVLLLESCTHHSTCEDIGRVKLPRMILKYTGKEIHFEYVAGLSPIEHPEKYAMAIQCGGCMSTRKQLLNRTNLFVNQGIPISNYGMALAYMNGIFERVMEVFK